MAQTLQSLLLPLLSLPNNNAHHHRWRWHWQLPPRPHPPLLAAHPLLPRPQPHQIPARLRTPPPLSIPHLLPQRSINTTTIRPPVLKRDGLYLVVVAICTAEGMHYYYLHLDTGSALTWTQCVLVSRINLTTNQYH